MAVRIAIIDRFQFVADAMRASLARHPGIDVVGVFNDVSDRTTETVRALHPDVILLEMKTGGTPLLRRLHTRIPEARIVAMTSVRDRAEEVAARAAGARGYLEKEHNQRGLIEEILAIVA